MGKKKQGGNSIWGGGLSKFLEINRGSIKDLYIRIDLFV